MEEVIEAFIYKIAMEEFSGMVRTLAKRFRMSYKTARMVLHGVLSDESVMLTLAAMVSRMMVNGVPYSKVRRMVVGRLLKLCENVIRGIRDRSIADAYI